MLTDSRLDLLSQAETLKNEGEHTRAIELLNRIIVADPVCCEAYEELGDNYMSLRQLRKAEKALKQARKMDETSANGAYLLGFLYSLQEKWDASIKSLMDADSHSPNHPEILRCLGWATFHRGQQNIGISLLERSFVMSPKDPNILCDLGVCYMGMQSYADATECFEKALELDPEFTQASDCLQMLQELTQPQQLEITIQTTTTKKTKKS